MEPIEVSLDDIDVSSILENEPTAEIQRSGRWAVREPKDVLEHVDPVLRRMPRTEADR